MANRGLLTKRDREKLQSEEDLERRDALRYNIRQRMENLEEDLQILREAGEEDLVDEFYEMFGREGEDNHRLEKLEREVEELREEVEADG